VRHAFNASSHRIVGKRCLLIDDVATTGATSTAAMQALLRGGAATVDLFTLARSDAWGEYRYEMYRSFGLHQRVVGVF
jgi:predicted amidophosphoribosyltransferase